MKKNIMKSFLIVVTVIFCFLGCSSEENKSYDSEEIRRYIASGNYDDAKKALDSVDESLIDDKYHLLYAYYYQDKNMGDDSRAFEKRDFNAAAEYLCDIYSDTVLSEISDEVRNKLNGLLDEKNVSEENKDKIRRILVKPKSLPK